MLLSSNAHQTPLSEQPELQRFNTLHIELWGIPGVGKSAVAAKLCGKLQEAGYETRLVQDYAKELSLQGKLAWRNGATGEVCEYEQFLISSEQYRRQSSMDGLVDVVISETPLLQQMIFAPDYYATELGFIISQLTAGWSSLDVLLTRDIRADYSSPGRIRSAEESIALQPEILKIVTHERPGFITMDTEGADKKIFTLANERLKKKRPHRPTL